jgi:hypothetical protein
MCDHFFEPEDKSPPAFWTRLNSDDIDTLKRQNCNRRFDASLVTAVAKRCSGGFPQVVVCLPVTSNGVPFPTVFWLTCPYLDHRCGELESDQKISDLENVFKERIPEVVKWHKKYSKLRASLLNENEAAEIKKKSLPMWSIISHSGVGGINWTEAPFAAKCLHLQTATWLGWNYHPAADWLVSELGSAECSDNICHCIC